ncbi:MAG: restriction endonuclease, partial [Herpetosiphonaceae bacterium]|nr:restriction endonuclease [Herpetosiphonaceae bacterium]
VLSISTGLTDTQRTGLLTGFLLLIPFPAFGVITSARSEQRARETREVQERRGGKLDRPGRVKSLDDLRALSLNQLGGYVADLFRRHGFLVDDYHFENRENLIEFNLRKDEQPWIVRVTVDDKVKQSAALQLNQYIRSQGITKGVLITSMEFQDQATRWAKDKPVALIDGPTLLSMDD